MLVKLLLIHTTGWDSGHNCTTGARWGLGGCMVDDWWLGEDDCSECSDYRGGCLRWLRRSGLQLVSIIQVLAQYLPEYSAITRVLGARREYQFLNNIRVHITRTDRGGKSANLPRNLGCRAPEKWQIIFIGHFWLLKPLKMLARKAEI